MSQKSRRLRRCLSLAAVACVLVGVVDSSPSQAAPISPIPEGPQTIQLVTVPTVIGATFSLDGTLITTGPDGLAVLPLNAARDLSRVELVNPGSGLAGGKAEFVRMTRAPDKDGLLRAYALFKISRDVSFTFRDSLGDTLPAERVTSLTIKSSIGESFTLSGAALTQPISLPSERSVAFVNGESAMKEIYYSVQEVVISGSNTVFRSQQKFFPINTSSFEVETVFYTLTIKTTDSLFGFATGSNIVIKWPDQHISKAPIHNGRAILPALPRGDYEMRIEGPGLNTWRPISVSRDQTVELQLISYLDGLVVLILLSAVAAACILVGRRRFGRHKSDEVEPAPLAPEPMNDVERYVTNTDIEQATIENVDVADPADEEPSVEEPPVEKPSVKKPAAKKAAAKKAPARKAAAQNGDDTKPAAKKAATKKPALRNGHVRKADVEEGEVERTVEAVHDEAVAQP